MGKQDEHGQLENLPKCAAEFVRLVIRKMRHRKKVRRDVQAELAAHFEDELKGCATEEEKKQKAQRVIAEFGDPKLLAVMLRRAKKRCRPLWAKVVLRSFQALGIIVLYLLICFGRLNIGTPTITVNYIERLNDLVRAGRDEADNARPYYEEAAKLYVETPQWLNESTVEWPADFNDVQRQSLVSWLEDNRRALEALRVATQRPYYWNCYQKSGELNSAAGILPGVMQGVMPSLSEYKKLARAMGWWIRYQAFSGNNDSAMKDCIVLQKLGDHLRSGGLLVEQLVGVAIEGLAHGMVFMVLDRANVSAAALRRVQDELEELYRRQGVVINFEAEKAFLYDQIQRTFTDDGTGDGRVLMRGLPYAVNGWRDGLWEFISFSYPSRREVLARIDRYFGQTDELFYRTPWDLRNEDTDEGKCNETLQRAGFMLRNLGPADKRVSQLAWRVKTGREALVTVLAVMRYRKEHGSYPADLEELVAVGYLDRLPMDPYSGRMLAYTPIGDRFLLYSCGANLKDDGWALGTGYKGQPRMWADNGDWVFWPVLRLETK